MMKRLLLKSCMTYRITLCDPFTTAVYCDYYNEQGQCSWHYEACGEMLTCSEHNYVPHKLEGNVKRFRLDSSTTDKFIRIIFNALSSLALLDHY